MIKKQTGNALTCENVHFRYFENSKKEILKGVNAAFPEGSKTLIMGRSGSGKSTLAMCLAGLYPENGGFLQEGSISLFGRTIEQYSLSERALSLSVMFQNPDLQFAMETLREEMIFCLENISCPREEMDQKIAEAAARAEMTEKLDQPLHSLSGGEKQKAALACIFLFHSKILILDEPFANLDNGWRKKLIAEFDAMCRDEGTTIIAIDHNAHWWLPVVDEIRILRDGAALTGGITKETIGQFRDLFREEGLAFPEECLPSASNAERSSDTRKEACRNAAETGMTGMSSPMIAIRGASVYAGKKKKRKKTDVKVLTDVNLCCCPGRITAVVGPSGAGKTTLFRTLIGVKDYDGEITVNGKELRRYKAKDLYETLGIVFQNPSNQFVTQNVLAEVLMGMPSAESRTPEAERRAKERLEAFRLGHFAKYSPYMLSQGQQRRLAVLGVMGGNQKILILDEPTYGQDDAMTELIMSLVREKADKEGLTVLFSSHDIRTVRTWADDICLVSGGHVRMMRKEELYDGTAESLL